ncbi:MAG: hypothetical protein ACRDS9_21825, partial [Pseudonocardiaceae bacterium]
LSLTLAAPVLVWGALPFHRAAWANLRHGAATMDMLARDDIRTLNLHEPQDHPPKRSTYRGVDQLITYSRIRVRWLASWVAAR